GGGNGVSDDLRAVYVRLRDNGSAGHYPRPVSALCDSSDGRGGSVCLRDRHRALPRDFVLFWARACRHEWVPSGRGERVEDPMMLIKYMAMFYLGAVVLGRGGGAR